MCPLCDWKPRNAKNTLNALRMHAVRTHNTNSEELYKILNPNEGICGCGKSLKFISLTIGYKKSCKSCHEKEWRAKAAATRIAKCEKAWNSGLTKETSDIVADIGLKVSAYRSENQIATWSKGLTKETDHRLAKMSEIMSTKYANGELTPAFKGETRDTNTKLVERGKKISEALAVYNPHKDPDKMPEIAAKISKTRRERIASGEIVPRSGFTPWCKGKNKETDTRLLEMATKVSNAKKGIQGWSRGLSRDTDVRLANIGDALRGKSGWLKGKSKENEPRLKAMADKRRLSHEEVMRRLTQHDNFTIVGNVEHVTTISNTKVVLKCNDCGVERERTLSSCFYPHKPRCQNCDSQHGSRWQQEIADYVRSLGFGDVLCNDTNALNNGMELDIFVPSKRVAIECHGLYWHSEAAGKHRAYHEMKKKCAQNADIKLIQLFEDEWNTRREQIKSIIAHKLGVSNVRIGARLCTTTCDLKLARSKLDLWHIEGAGRRSELGLLLQTSDGAVVAVATFGKPLHASDDVVELHRFATAPGVVVAGGLGKLVKHAASTLKCKNMMTYVDTRLGEGKGYEAIGFIFKRQTGLRFWFTDFHVRYNRFKFKATGVMSQNEVAEAAKVYRIYGCVNNVYELNFS